MDAINMLSLIVLLLLNSCCFARVNDTGCHPKDLQALRDFAGNLADGWTALQTWSRETPLCCSWEGVSCDGVRVVGLRLPGLGLNGTISGSLGFLDLLIHLDLSRNRLAGVVPAELGNLRELVLLDLSCNGLSGSIAGVVKGLVSLRALNVSGNAFGGEIDGDFCSGFSGLRSLDLSSNRFHGVVKEDCFSNCRSTMQELYLDSNSLSGDLPNSLFDLHYLNKLSVSWNNFSGHISRNLSNLSRLKTLVLDGNRFSGPLPDVFGSLAVLEQLIAHSNSLTGALPSSLSLCSELHELNLRNNSLSGHVNLDFSTMPLLESLDLATNRFTGPLPVSLSNCTELKTLSLAKNELLGQVPEEFSNLVSLTFLSLSNNSFHNISGALRVLQRCKNLTTLILTMNFYKEEIPESINGFSNLLVFALGNCGLAGKMPIWLRSFKKLEVLDLSWNHLNGTIPAWVGEFKNLFYLDISNNSFVGEIPRSLTCLKALMSVDVLPETSLIHVPLYVKRNQSSSGMQYNQVSGFPPSLYLNDNKLNGTIWPEFGQLKQLHVLDLSNNRIHGAIPVTISQMENLEVLDLSFNELRGRIPGSLSKLTFLSKFSVAHNHLEGEIPRGGQFFSFSNSSFAGNPGLCSLVASSCETVQSMPASPVDRHGHSMIKRKGAIIGITISIGVGICALLAVLLNVSRKEIEEPLCSGEREDKSDHISESIGSKLVLLFHNSNGKELTIMDVLRSTNNFNQANIIGCGGFGLVYKASLPDGTIAAIKRLSGDCGQVEREFRAEIEALSKAQHPNLVSLKGYCKHGGDRLLIYSYMENGSLDYWLHEKEDGGSILTWTCRLKIAQGASRGLAYLHKVCEPNIIHRDIKSSNILLDERFEAHLADFGLSRIIEPYDTHVTTDLVGTLGYIPPEYSQTWIATMKGDVFSFGVVMLELLTGRRPVDVCKGKGSRDLVSWARQMKLERKEELVFDPLLWNKQHERQLLAVLEIACKCISVDPRNRPSIDQVVSWLNTVD